jgi:uncharacterized glyoxalase superfamily protein PhnB
MVENRSMPRSDVIAELTYDDVDAAVDWLCEVFGFRERWRAPGHRAQLAFGNGAVVVMEPRAGTAAGEGSALVRVEDVDAHFERAQRLGATIVGPPADHPYGERQYNVEDLAGRRWTFTQSIADVAPEQWGGISADLG